MNHTRFFKQIIKELINNLELVTIQLVLHHYKTAGSIVVKLPNHQPKIHFKKIIDKDFIWCFEKLKNLIQISIINRKKNAKLKNTELF